VGVDADAIDDAVTRPRQGKQHNSAATDEKESPDSEVLFHVGEPPNEMSFSGERSESAATTG